MNSALALTDAIDYPMESHVHGLGSFGLDGFVRDAVCRCIVSADGSGTRLNVAHLLQVLPG